MPTAQSRHDISIRRWTEIPDAKALVPAVDAIFFEASATKTFADERERAAFRERWLGRYLEHEPRWAYLALDRGRVAGYLVGSVADPVTAAQSCDDSADFAALTAALSRAPARQSRTVLPQSRDRRGADRDVRSGCRARRRVRHARRHRSGLAQRALLRAQRVCRAGTRHLQRPCGRLPRQATPAPRNGLISTRRRGRCP